MDPYAKPKERRVGADRPKIKHLPQAAEPRTRRERQIEKQAVVAQRRAIKKAARRHLKQQLLNELEDVNKAMTSDCVSRLGSAKHAAHRAAATGAASNEARNG